MPEGPEVRRDADRISKRLIGQELESIEFIYPPIQEFQPVVADSEIVSITTRGKAMLTRFDCGLSLYSHNQLYGRWTVNRRSTELNWQRSLRVEFLTKKHAVRLWSATDVEIIPSSQENNHPFISKLGPDVLDDSCTPEVIMEMLGEKRYRNRKASNLMLDQSFLAGLGNYLRSEILHHSGVNPHAKPSELSVQKRRAWAEEAKRLCVMSYHTGGLTVPKEVADMGKERGERRRSYRHAVFCRNGLPCLSCGTTVVREIIGGRRLDFCPSCQSIES
tara:strand:+ start:869 stop:1696 length:828 start_codon:yes stop_codon:yes gene_type:complete